jgi:hypothetical protein
MLLSAPAQQERHMFTMGDRVLIPNQMLPPLSVPSDGQSAVLILLTRAKVLAQRLFRSISYKHVVAHIGCRCTAAGSCASLAMPYGAAALKGHFQTTIRSPSGAAVGVAVGAVEGGGAASGAAVGVAVGVTAGTGRAVGAGEGEAVCSGLLGVGVSA